MLSNRPENYCLFHTFLLSFLNALQYLFFVKRENKRLNSEEKHCIVVHQVKKAIVAVDRVVDWLQVGELRE